MNPRFEAIKTIGKRPHRFSGERTIPSEIFGHHVFNTRVMRKMLPKKVFANILQTMEGRAEIDPQYATMIAEAMKEWAIKLGATHYTHLFQPLTGATAEKHDAFIDFGASGKPIEKFSGKQLIQGEPDASSFPSGGLRSTYEARGYTGWDPHSPAFIWKGGDGVTLCIPSVFFSWTGDILDNKIPLLRSDKKISDAILRLLSLTGLKAKTVHSTIGLEQEYFLIDRSFRDLRPDLINLGKTVFGAEPSKGQELQDHYFGSVKDRVLNFMHEFEVEALKLGIPVKTRHNEVAPGQYEVAPVFEKASLAIDHNITLMELMRQVALKHNFVCLLHEKPFSGLNGSGKHCNWSLVTDTGVNLLDPTDTPENNTHFLILLTAILCAVDKHAELLRASIGSVSNDCRLGGHEAPPAIMSVYLGEALETFLDNIESTGTHTSKSGKVSYDLGIQNLPELKRDNTDRNRTSPFAFTGNKFEMRALGSAAHPAFLVTSLNVMVADCLNHILDEVEKDHFLPVIQKYLKASKRVRFSGDNYGEEWIKEAASRKLLNIKRSAHAYESLLSEETLKAFSGILNEYELKSRYEVALEIYATTSNIEANLMRELFYTCVLPAAISQQKSFAKSLSLIENAPEQKRHLQQLTETIEKALMAARELEEARVKAMEKPLASSARDFCDEVIEKGERLRSFVDQLEQLVDDQLWTLPKYREMLFII